jgi:hypothetical protein
LYIDFDGWGIISRWPFQDEIGVFKRLREEILGNKVICGGLSPPHIRTEKGLERREGAPKKVQIANNCITLIRSYQNIQKHSLHQLFRKFAHSSLDSCRTRIATAEIKGKK